MMEFGINIDLSQLATAIPAVREELRPAIKTALYEITRETEAAWKRAVHGASLWSGSPESDKERYLASINWRPTGEFSTEVYSDFPLAEKIETGRPARDLKRALDTSPKVRQSKNGKRYLIIPFRHNTPGASATGQPMPAHVYKEAKQLAPSRVTGQTRRLSGTGAHDIKTRRPMTVNQNIYKWGGRLQEGLAPKMRTHHKTDPYAGMVRFDTGTGRSKRSTYMTFRVMHEDSPGWIVPAKPGLYIARQVTQEMQQIADQRFGQMMQDFLDAAGRN